MSQQLVSQRLVRPRLRGSGLEDIGDVEGRGKRAEELQAGYGADAGQVINLHPPRASVAAAAGLLPVLAVLAGARLGRGGVHQVEIGL